MKMSKSRGNVIAPDDYVREFGADVVRCYLMFLGPWSDGGEWSDTGINGVSRWLNRVWDVAQRDPARLDETPADEGSVRGLRRRVHQTIKRVTGDLRDFKFNTAIAALMELTNAMNQAWEEGRVDGASWREAVENLLLLMAPMAPHLAEELWERTGHPYSIHNRPWPQWDPELAAEEVITLVFQVNGRVRDTAQAPVDVTEEEAKAMALASRRVQAHLQGKEVQRIIYVPGRLVNIVAR